MCGSMVDIQSLTSEIMRGKATIIIGYGPDGQHIVRLFWQFLQRAAMLALQALY